MSNQISQTIDGAKNTFTSNVEIKSIGDVSQPRIDQAETQADTGHLHLAREIYEQILSTQPDHLESLMQLGQLEVEQGRTAEGVAKLTKASEISQNDAMSQHQLGLAFATVGEVGLAEQTLRRATQLDPEMTDAHMVLGKTLKQQSKLGEAASSFQQALRLDGNHGEAYNELGGTLEQQGELEGALFCYQEALVKQVVRDAFEIGMQQVRPEIESLARLVLLTKPLNILEIGSLHGGTMSLWCKLLKDGGKRIAIDLPSSEINPEEIQNRNARMEQWSDQMTILDSCSHDIATYEKVRETLGGDQIDFLFLDGDHSYEGSKLDFFMYKGLVREGGFIALQGIRDTELHRQNNCQVSQLWQELGGEKMEIQAGGEWGGIGVIQN